MDKVYVEIVVVLLSIEDWLCGGKKLFFNSHAFVTLYLSTYKQVSLIL